MNKGRRIELKKLHYQRRMRNFGYNPYAPVKEDGKNFTGFINHGKPCSCSVCSPITDKYNRAHQKQSCMKIIGNSLEEDR